MSSRNWPTPSTRCSPGWKRRSPGSAGSWPTPPRAAHAADRNAHPDRRHLASPAASAAQLEPVLAAIGAAVDKSGELIEALLTLARSDRGPGPAELVNLPTAVEDAIDSIGPAATARQIHIGTTLHDAQVPGDRVLLERLVRNLIDDAVRHNVTGGWVLASTRTGAGIAEITVSNGGEHIPADQVPGVFEPFRRLSGRTGKQPGSGLGLSIVESVANAHGGHAEAHARPDGGLDVQVTPPATVNGPHARSPPTADPRAPDLAARQPHSSRRRPGPRDGRMRVPVPARARGTTSYGCGSCGVCRGGEWFRRPRLRC